MGVAKMTLKSYLVGGAVRDALLGIPSSDRDYVVVGHTVDDMLSRGFVQVGNDFPVFLHPETGDEYALARVERKVGVGYNGFTCECNGVTLAEDMFRRDLTINSMAIGDDGTIIDYYGGREDLENGILRHVSPAFAEDPVRVLRVARFAARYGFTVADDTMFLMQAMVKAGEMNDLTSERVWKEVEKALGENTPSVFFTTLSECGALEVILPELFALQGATQSAEHHPEGDAWVHTMMVVDHAASAGYSLPVRFAALCHDLGKGVTPVDQLPRHIGHEDAGVPLVNALCDRLKVPSACREMAVMATREHLRVHLIPEMTPRTIVNLFMRCDAFRRPARFVEMLNACIADHYGRSGDRKIYMSSVLAKVYLEAAQSVDTGKIAASVSIPSDIGEAIRIARIMAVKQAKKR
jgi:tRNA nucleotidyltransferase (CCA-adding enzyme)